MSKQFEKFIAVSFVAAAANIGSRIVLGVWLNYTLSILVAFVIGLNTAFVLNRLLVFAHAKNPLHYQMMWFVIVNLIAAIQTLVVSLLLADVLFPFLGFSWHIDTVSHVIGVGVPVFTSYFGHKYFTFPSASAPLQSDHTCDPAPFPNECSLPKSGSASHEE